MLPRSRSFPAHAGDGIRLPPCAKRNHPATSSPLRLPDQRRGASMNLPTLPTLLSAFFLRYLSEQEPGHLPAQIDRLAKHGERDYVLLSILYDTGARIQELLDLTPRDFHLESPPFVCVRGKGRRERLCPLLPQSARLVQ